MTTENIVNLLKTNLVRKFSYWRWKVYGKFKNRKNQEIANKIAEYGLFDADWYCQQHPDVAAAGIDPFVHYVKYGYKKLRNPHWLFDVKYCLEKYPEIKGEDPILYYCKQGWKKKMQPHPLFDIHWYLDRTPGALGKNPLVHYLTEGWKEGISPNPLFDPKWYLDRYPDLPKNLHPLQHYIKHGMKENRSPNVRHVSLERAKKKFLNFYETRKARCYFKKNIKQALEQIDHKKETILLISHDASRTGAPVLVYNLAKSFKEKYNIILLTLGSGSLIPFFQHTVDVMVGPLPMSQYHADFFTVLLKKILEKVTIKYAIVNTIVATPILKSLFENDICILHLIHEFSAYTLPRGLFLNSAFFSDKQIYSANIVRENAIKDAPQLKSVSSVILPQGICDVPAEKKCSIRDEQQVKAISEFLRPQGWPQDTVVIVGAGTVSLRKGVDLFIACAKRVLELGPKKKFRFVWIGEGFDPECDAIYSVYLEDQIFRSHLTDVVSIIKPIQAINIAYTLSDILFLSSRLDPLPLVSLDALHHKKPLVCFESATGIAEHLGANEHTAFGIVPYLDVEVAAQRIFKLIENDEFRLKMGEAGGKIARATFDFGKYVAHLDEIALGCMKDRKQELEDEKIIRDTTLLNKGYAFMQYAQLPYVDSIKWYIRNQKAHFHLRKPFPGFHPEVYAEQHQLNGRSALAHYIENGEPFGPWNDRLIKNQPRNVSCPSLTTALHIHLYYPDMAAEILHRLRNINYPIDLLVSVVSDDAMTAATEIFSTYANGAVLIKKFPNRGRNFGSLLTGFRNIVLERYKIIGHIHTKKSSDMGGPGIFDSMLWVHFLYTNLIGGEYGMANHIIQEFQNAPKLGLLFPDDPNIVNWGKNKPFAEELTEKMGIKFSRKHEHLNFPVGSMFWARTDALNPLFNLNLNWEDYPEEPLPHDGNMLHAMERLLPSVIKHAGYESAVTYVEGMSR